MNQLDETILISSLSNNFDTCNALWIKVETFVKNIQKKIYQSSLLGDNQYLRRYQEFLINSKEAKYIALKRVIKLNNHTINTNLDNLSINDFRLIGEARTFYATFLGKFNKKRKKPTFEDLVLQNLVLLIIEPEWEARLENSSYGFRKGYSLRQAIIKTHAILTQSSYYTNATIISCRIKSSFSEINFNSLLRKTGYAGLVLQQLQAWLTANYLENEYKALYSTFQYFDIYSFQNYTICPILADIIFYGLQQSIEWHNIKITKMNKCSSISITHVVRYATEIIVIFPNNESIRITKILRVIQKFITTLGLQLDKSSITLSSIYEGFDFLGCHFKRYNNHSYWNMEDSKLLISPMKENVKKHFRSIKRCLYHKDKLNRWRANSQMRQDDVIEKLNPLIQIFSDYYCCFVPLKILKRIDWTVNEIIYRYAIKKYKSAKYEKWNSNWIKIINGKKKIAYQDSFNKTIISLKLHTNIAYQVYKSNRVIIPNYLYNNESN
nr:putative reverse transcriptase/maturase [Boldiaceae sp.]